MNQKKWPLVILPILLLLFLLFTLSGMKSYEQRIVVLYHEHTLLLGQLAKTNDSDVQDTLIAQFSKKIELSKTEERKITLSTKLQNSIDAITFGTAHCLTTKHAPCKVYNSEVIDAAQSRQKRIAVIQKKFPEDPIADAQAYTTLELIFKGIVLAIEGIVVSLLIRRIINRARKK